MVDAVNVARYQLPLAAVEDGLHHFKESDSLHRDLVEAIDADVPDRREAVLRDLALEGLAADSISIVV